MIIECAVCRSKFNLDENLLKKQGSKVRCSICKQVFVAYPTEFGPAEELPDLTISEELEETVALDSPPILERREQSPAEYISKTDFEKISNEAIEENIVAVSLDDIPDEEEAPHDLKEAASLAESIEEQISREDVEKNAEMKGEGMEGAEKAPVPGKPGGLSRFMKIGLGVIVLLLACGVGIYLLAPDLLPESLSILKPPKKEDVSDAGISRLAFKDVKGSFMQSEKAGQLFLIQGVVTNHYAKPRNFILLKGSLLDDKGKVVKTKMTYAGNTFTDDQLKTMSLEEINKGLKNRPGNANTNVNVKPEGDVPFTVVIEELPENLSEFTVEAVSSSPSEQ